MSKKYIEGMIKWFMERKGKVTYSMTHRNGPTSYDCSSAIYFALLSAGGKADSYPVNTETEHAWLIANGATLISDNQDWNMERGDVIIWGKKGYSLGSAGHTMLALDSENIIHCNYGNNGISIDNYNNYWYYNNAPYVYVYRFTKGDKLKTPYQVATQGMLETLAGEVMTGKHGSGEQRKRSLGDYYTSVQTIVNERLKAITASESHKRLAKEVLKNKLGTGAKRIGLLGTYYETVQELINTKKVK